MTDVKTIREEWLIACAEEMDTALFGGRMPPYRVTCGWPTSRAISKKNRTIGQCFHSSTSGDNKNELIISMYLDDPIEVAATMPPARADAHLLKGVKATCLQLIQSYTPTTVRGIYVSAMLCFFRKLFL